MLQSAKYPGPDSVEHLDIGIISFEVNAIICMP